MVISVSLGHLDKAVRELRKYAKKLKDSTAEIDRRLSEIAADEARTHFDSDVSVTAEEHGVLAEGYSVAFQEFGAGAAVQDPYPGGANVSFEINRGSWSREHQGEYFQTDYEFWHYGGQRYEYIQPRSGLFNGMMEAKERAAEVVKEVLSK